MKFFISSTEYDQPLEGALIKDEVVDLPTGNVYGAITEYNDAHPDRKAISSGVVLPGTPDDHLRDTFPRYHRDGQWVTETD
jgi:hypothetical protein